MSNYNSTLQSNNTDLQAILNTINELPEAVEQATPTISVNTSGLITATAGTKSSTHQLAFQPAKTITPTTANQIAVSSGYYTGGDITVKGDSNLVAGNIKSGVSIFGVNGSYVGNSSSGDASMEDGLITRTMRVYENNRISKIGNYAFYMHLKLASVSFPVCTSIGINAFKGCNSLTTVSFPVCTNIGANAFDGCTVLKTANFSKCTIINGRAFAGCNSLATVSFPVCTSIGFGAFNQCRNLTTVSFPACVSIGNGAFDSCSKLKTANFSKCTIIDQNAFSKCSKLTTISFPACVSIGINAFVSCYSLTTVSFPVCTNIGANAFYSCSKLTTIYLLASSVCTLDRSQAFSGCSLTSIYVPQSLLTSYKTATNWTYFSSRFVAYRLEEPDDPEGPFG